MKLTNKTHLNSTCYIVSIKKVAQKGTRIAADFVAPVLKDSAKEKEKSNSIQSTQLNKMGFSEKRLLSQMDIAEQENNFVKQQLDRLKPFGDLVLRIDNLPIRLTVHALNLMLGTSTLEESQLFAVKNPGQGPNGTMNLRVVIASTNEDSNIILSKNCRKTHDNSTVYISKSDFKDLESFIKRKRTLAIRLDTGEQLPDITGNQAHDGQELEQTNF